MSSNKFVGQLKQNNEQINNLKAVTAQTEKHMVDHEQKLTNTVNEFMEYQNYELKKHTANFDNPHQVTKEQIGLGNVLDVEQASKSEFYSHLDNTKNPHSVTKDQIGLSNVTNDKQATKTEFDLHTEDVICHVTSTDRITWNSKETTEGSQSKADEALTNSKTYTDKHALNKLNPHGVTKEQVGLGNVSNDQQATKADFDKHVSDAVKHIASEERIKWNAAQLMKLTSDNGKRIKIPDGTDILTLPTGFYYGSNANLPNAPVIEAAWYNYDVFTGDSGRKSIIAYGSFDVTMWIGMVHTDGAFKGWKKIVTYDIFDKVTWQNVALKNGASNGERIFQYAKWGRLLLLRGHIATNREIICGSLPAGFYPSSGATIDVTVSGTAGISKLVISTDGSLKITDILSKDDSLVTGYYMDKVIPLD
ncbi:hypothetical protein ACFVIX_15830 [Bacillus subtilis]